MQMDASILSTAVDAWERDPSAYSVTPFHAFSAAHPTESSYLWQLSRGAAPPAELVDAALCNLVAWALIDEHGAVTTLGRRLIEARGEVPATRAPATRAPAARASASTRSGSKTTTKTVRYLGACKRCKRAARPHGIRIDAKVTTTRTEIPTTTLSGAEGRTRVKYAHIIDMPGEDRKYTTDARRTSVTCARCVAAGISPAASSVLVEAVRGVKTDTKCGARCRNSTGPSCECSCGGANHGSGI